MFIKEKRSVVLVGLSLVLGFAQTLNYAALAAAESVVTQTEQTSTQSPKMRLNALSTNTSSGLTPAAEEAASLLGILPQVERLMQLSKNRTDSQTMSDEELSLRVEVLDKIMGGTLEVRMVAGRIDPRNCMGVFRAGHAPGKTTKDSQLLVCRDVYAGRNFRYIVWSMLLTP